MINVHVNGLNDPIKKHRVAKGIKNKIQGYSTYKRYT